jgi:hypothetical protein
MAGNWYMISVVVLCINLFLYIGVSVNDADTFLEGDLLSKLVDNRLTHNELDSSLTQTNITVNDNTVEISELETQDKSFQQFIQSITDALSLVYSGIKSIFNFILAPFLLFRIEGMPYFIALLISVPLAIAHWLSIIQLIRGAS